MVGNKETMQVAGYQYLRFDRAAGGHILKDAQTGTLEVWIAKKSHPGYGIIFRNTHLIFAKNFIERRGIVGMRAGSVRNFIHPSQIGC